MDYRHALDIARRNLGATVTRGTDGSFVVLHPDGSEFSASDLAKDELEGLKRENAFLQRRYDDVSTQLEEERRSRQTDIAALDAKLQQAQLALHAAKEEQAQSVSTNEHLKAQIAKVSPEEWARIKAAEEEDKKAYAQKLRAERRVQHCSCQGEVENCVRCDGRGSYTVDGFGNVVCG